MNLIQRSDRRPPPIQNPKAADGMLRWTPGRGDMMSTTRDNTYTDKGGSKRD